MKYFRIGACLLAVIFIGSSLLFAADKGDVEEGGAKNGTATEGAAGKNAANKDAADNQTTADGESPQLTVPVRVLSTQQTPPRMMNDAQFNPQPTIDVTRRIPPQYESVRPVRTGEPANPDDPSVRFFVPLVERLLLIEARITIDGVPFHNLREQRIDDLLAELAKPVPEVSPETPSETSAEPVSDVSPTPETSPESTPASGDESTPEPVVETAPESAVETASEPATGTATEPATDPSADPSADTPQPEEPNQPGQPNQPSEPDVDESPDETPDATPDETPATRPVVDTSIIGRLRRYAVATGRPPRREEARWLLRRWFEGPVVLLLDENFERIRRDKSPVFQILDRDEDGTLSAEELGLADQTLLKYDRNQDDVLSFDEIMAAAKSRTPQNMQVRTPHLAPFVFPEALADSSLLSRLADAYASNDAETASHNIRQFDVDGNGRLDDAERGAIDALQPNVQIEVVFHSSAPERSRLTITYLDPSLSISQTSMRQASITLQIGRTYLDISAVQMRDLILADQVSLGAVHDGYPLLPDLDLNEDGRLTLRELWRVPQQLQAYDLDQDGSLTVSELLPTVRLSIGHGAIVHQELAKVRSLHPAMQTPAPMPPDWFARMDRNQDGDLTLREFLGGKEQFQELDTDGDGLVSIAEADPQN